MAIHRRNRYDRSMRATIMIALLSCAAVTASAAPAMAKTHAAETHAAKTQAAKISAAEIAATRARNMGKISRVDMNERSGKAAAAARKKLDAREKSREIEMNRLLRGICTGC